MLARPDVTENGLLLHLIQSRGVCYSLHRVATKIYNLIKADINDWAAEAKLVVEGPPAIDQLSGGKSVIGHFCRWTSWSFCPLCGRRIARICILTLVRPIQTRKCDYIETPFPSSKLL